MLCVTDNTAQEFGEFVHTVGSCKYNASCVHRQAATNIHYLPSLMFPCQTARSTQHWFLHQSILLLNIPDFIDLLVFLATKNRHGSRCISWVILLPFDVIATPFENNRRWSWSTICTDCNNNSNILSSSSLLLILGSFLTSSKDMFSLTTRWLAASFINSVSIVLFDIVFG